MTFQSAGAPRQRLALACLVLLVGMTLGCGSLPFGPSQASTVNDAAGAAPRARTIIAVDDYVIGVPDELLVTVWQHPDVSGPVLVRRDGKISVPLMGDILAAGLTPKDLAEQIRIGLADFISKPRVDVAVTDMRSQVASVIGGGVVRSGLIQIQRNTRIVDAIAEMGGLTPFAKRRKIRLIRETAEGRREFRFDYTAFVRGDAPTSNVLLEPGDTLVVPE